MMNDSGLRRMSISDAAVNPASVNDWHPLGVDVDEGHVVGKSEKTLTGGKTYHPGPYNYDISHDVLPFDLLF